MGQCVSNPEDFSFLDCAVSYIGGGAEGEEGLVHGAGGGEMLLGMKTYRLIPPSSPCVDVLFRSAVSLWCRLGWRKASSGLCGAWGPRDMQLLARARFPYPVVFPFLSR